MKLLRKISAVICAIALVVTSVVFYPSNARAESYDSLTYKTLGDNVAFSRLSDGIEGMSPDSPLLLDGGMTLQFAFAATNENVKLQLNGENVTKSDERVIELGNNIVKINPQKFADNSYTLITITSSKGTSEYVIKKGNPTSSGEIPTGSGETDTTSEQKTTQPGQTTAAPVQTTTAQASSSVPKKLLGLDTATVSGTDKIDNAVMFAWAGADNPDNVDGYDPSVTSAVIYIYKDGTLVTKIGNATNGGVVGGLSAGNYTAQAANVNSKGEGPLSEAKAFTVTGDTLNYAYPKNCVGPKTPNGLSLITGNPEVPADNPAQADNKLGVAWAPSSQSDIPAYDPSVVGYNLYIFDAATGTPYRRAYIDGASTSNVILESVSSGTYLVFLSAVNAEGEESAFAAPSFGQSSKVTVKGEKIDNAQSFDKPNQPTLPLGLTIITEGIQYGFTVAWSSDSDFTGQKLNLFVDGVCIKCGINGNEPSYYENRLASGTYTVEVRSQYTSNNVESFGLSKTITVAADPGLDTKTPAELADPSYQEYQEIETTGQQIESTNDADETTVNSVETTGGSVETTKGDDIQTTVIVQTTKEIETPTGKPSVTNPTTAKPKSTIAPKNNIKVGKVSVKSAVKKKNAKKVNIKFKKVTGATKYKIQISNKKNFKRVLVNKTVKKVSVKLSSKKIKKVKKLYVRVKAVRVVSGKTYEGAWSKPKRIKIKK